MGKHHKHNRRKRADTALVGGSFRRFLSDGDECLPAAMVVLRHEVERLLTRLDATTPKRLGYAISSDREARDEARMLLRDIVDGEWNRAREARNDLDEIRRSWLRIHPEVVVLRELARKRVRTDASRLSDSVILGIRQEFNRRVGGRMRFLDTTLGASYGLRRSKPWRFPWTREGLMAFVARTPIADVTHELLGKLHGYSPETIREYLKDAKRAHRTRDRRQQNRSVLSPRRTRCPRLGSPHARIRPS
ncbi:MAG: hypothetical protein AABZ30_00350 [Myxococcota bacterium]